MLDVLLEGHERFGPVFTLRTFHLASVWMLGPEANRFMLVSDRDKFIWRDGLLGDLIPLIGDGLLTTDGEYHDVARRIMMPAFHRDHVVAATSIMLEEADRAIDGAGGRAIASTSTTGHVTSRCGSRCVRSSASTRMRPAATMWLASSSAGSPSTGPSSCSRYCAGRGRPSSG